MDYLLLTVRFIGLYWTYDLLVHLFWTVSQCTVTAPFGKMTSIQSDKHTIFTKTIIYLQRHNEITFQNEQYSPFCFDEIYLFGKLIKNLEKSRPYIQFAIE